MLLKDVIKFAREMEANEITFSFEEPEVLNIKVKTGKKEQEIISRHGVTYPFLDQARDGEIYALRNIKEEHKKQSNKLLELRGKTR